MAMEKQELEEQSPEMESHGAGGAGMKPEEAIKAIELVKGIDLLFPITQTDLTNAEWVIDKHSKSRFRRSR